MTSISEKELQLVEAGIIPLTITGEITELTLLGVNGQIVGTNTLSTKGIELEPLLHQLAGKHTAIKVVSKEIIVCGTRRFQIAHYYEWYHLFEDRWQQDELVDIGRYVPCYRVYPGYFRYASCRGHEASIANDFEQLPALHEVDADLDRWSLRWIGLDEDNCSDLSEWEAFNAQGKLLTKRAKAVLGDKANIIFYDSFASADKENEKMYFIADVRETLRDRQAAQIGPY